MSLGDGFGPQKWYKTTAMMPERTLRNGGCAKKDDMARLTQKDSHRIERRRGRVGQMVEERPTWEQNAPLLRQVSAAESAAREPRAVAEMSTPVMMRMVRALKLI